MEVRMKKCNHCILFTVVLLCMCFAFASAHVEKVCDSNQLKVRYIPQQSIFPPETICRKEDKFINLNFFEINKEAPKMTYKEADENSLYTVVMVDPNAPGSNTWLHWIVVDIEGDELKRGFDIHMPHTLLKEYNPPTPPPGQKHEYILRLCRQPGGRLDITDEDTSIGRAHFNDKKFMYSHNLKEIATSSFLTERK